MQQHKELTQTYYNADAGGPEEPQDPLPADIFIKFDSYFFY